MDRRQLFRQGTVAAAGIIFGSAARVNGVIPQASRTHSAFGSYGDELLIEDDGATYVADSGLHRLNRVDSNEIGDQFFVFQLVPTKERKWYIKSPQDIEPLLETNNEAPDVALDCRLLSFHVGDEDKMDPDIKATVRITFGTEHNTRRSRDMGQQLYWAISSGLNLWNTRGLRAQPRDYRADFREIFGNKFVELPGGAGTLKVEIVKHRKSSWWEKAFNFSNSAAGIGLVSALGFPGVTSRVLHFVDEAANRFVGENAKVLFSSRGLPIAFTKQASNEITQTGTRIGGLNAGIWVFARGRDLPLLASKEMTYDATLRRLFPRESNVADIVSGKTLDPLRGVTYAVMSARMKARKINIGF